MTPVKKLYTLVNKENGYQVGTCTVRIIEDLQIQPHTTVSHTTIQNRTYSQKRYCEDTG